MKPSIAILDDYQNVALGLADWDRLGAPVTVFRDHLFEGDELVARLQPFDAIAMMRERTPFTRSLIARLPNLKLLLTSGMVNRGIDLAACAERGIVVSGTQGPSSPVSETTWALLLALAQRIPFADREIREGDWQRSGLNEALQGKTLGIIGLGKVGAKIARFAKAFEMDVVAWSQNLTAARAEECGARLVERDELLRTADAVTIHLVLSDRTRGLIGNRELGLMKPTAWLINTSRGPIVDEAALLDALREGRIAGAGLDVFDTEPLPADSPMRTAPNTVLTPHLGYVTRGSYEVYYTQMVEDIEAWINGAPIRVLKP
jgi:phosphoglycerate dehydrogenase-like enzyme